MPSIKSDYNPPKLSDEDIERDLARNDLLPELKSLLIQELARRRMVEVKNAVDKLNTGSDRLIFLTRWLIALTIVLAVPVLWSFGQWLFTLCHHQT